MATNQRTDGPEPIDLKEINAILSRARMVVTDDGDVFTEIHAMLSIIEERIESDPIALNMVRMASKLVHLSACNAEELAEELALEADRFPM